ncbi:MAG TPA: class I SAM-dependent methyltransferase, partial [Acidobacteriota bacterium]|nr:class I SAM-dependent methyltransferase [Acidobacteriota bacterium]
HPMTTTDEPSNDHEADWSDETAQWYASAYGEWPSNHITVEAIALRVDDVVVDIGCGTACALRHAAQYVTEGRLIGCDPVPGMMHIARQKLAEHPDHERIECGAGDLRLDDATATIAMAINSLHHWDDIAGGLAEVLRVLVPGGSFYVAEDHDVQELHGWGANDVRLALLEAGFAVGETPTVSQGEVVMDLHHARKPAGAG